MLNYKLKILEKNKFPKKVLEILLKLLKLKIIN